MCNEQPFKRIMHFLWFLGFWAVWSKTILSIFTAQMNELQEIFSCSAAAITGRGWIPRTVGGLRVWDLLVRRIKDDDLEIGNEPKLWIKLRLSLKQDPLVDRVSSINLFWNSHWLGIFSSDRHYILKEKEGKNNSGGTDSWLSGWQHTSNTGFCFGREQSDLVAVKDVLLVYVVMSCKNTLDVISGFRHCCPVHQL